MDSFELQVVVFIPRTAITGCTVLGAYQDDVGSHTPFHIALSVTVRILHSRRRKALSRSFPSSGAGPVL